MVSLFLCQNFSIDFFSFGEFSYTISLPNPSCIFQFSLIYVRHSLDFSPISIFSNISSSLFQSLMPPIPPSSGDVNWYSALRTEVSTWLMIRQIKKLNGRNSGSMLGTLNPYFQKGLLVPPKSRRAGRVEDLVASKLKPFFVRLPLLRKRESLEIMWSSRLSVAGRSLFSCDNILPLDMKARRIPLGCHQSQWLSLK